MTSKTSLSDANIIKYSQIIANKFNLDIEKSMRLAIKAIDAFEAHGGCSSDYDGMIKVINVVVDSWISEEDIK